MRLPGAAVIVAVAVGAAACSAPAPSASPRVSPVAQSTATPAPAAASIPVVSAGTFAGGGLWAIEGSSWLVSTDAGTSWRGNTMPIASGSTLNAIALDAAHAWLLSSGPGSTLVTGDPTTDILHLVVHRTTDGGATWQASTVPGSFAEHSAALVFVDASHGYLLSAPQRFSDYATAVLRTDDGGASWQVAGIGPELGSQFSVSDSTTLWAGAEATANPLANYPTLAVSRDGGRSWQAVQLPGLEGQSGPEAWLDGPPVFLDPTNGIVTITSIASSPSETRIYRTADAGRSWTLVSERAVEAATGPALLDATHWLLPLVNPFGVEATSDAGATWHEITTTGLANGGWIVWIGALDASHAAVLVPPGHSYPEAALLFISADGGHTWLPPSLGAISAAAAKENAIAALASVMWVARRRRLP